MNPLFPEFLPPGIRGFLVHNILKGNLHVVKGYTSGCSWHRMRMQCTHRMDSALGPTGPISVQTTRSRSLFVHTLVVPSAGCWLSWNEEINLSRRRRGSTQKVYRRKKYRNCEAVLARESSITQNRSWVRAQILFAASLGIERRAAGWFVLVSTVAVVYWLSSLPNS